MELNVLPAWEALRERLLHGPSWRTLMVAGPINAGKTTLACWLAMQLQAHARTLFLDADPGQSLIGPPTTLALGRVPIDPDHWLKLRFVGHVSPEGHLLQMLGGLVRLVEVARRYRAQHLVIDLPGHMPGDVGRELFFQMIDVLRPDYVVALQREAELETVLQCFRRSRPPRIVRLPVAEAVQERDRWVRSDYRRMRFQRYFAKARLQQLSVRARGLHGIVPALDHPETVRYHLVALCDRYGFAQVLGLVVRYEAELSRLHLWAPPFRAQEIATIQFGRFRMDPSELGLGSQSGSLTTGNATIRTGAMDG